MRGNICLSCHSEWCSSTGEQYDMRELVSLNLPSTYSTVEHFHSTQREIVLMLLYLSMRNFLAIFFDP
jgi:hypothetical protein